MVRDIQMTVLVRDIRDIRFRLINIKKCSPLLALVGIIDKTCFAMLIGHRETALSFPNPIRPRVRKKYCPGIDVND